MPVVTRRRTWGPLVLGCGAVLLAVAVSVAVGSRTLGPGDLATGVPQALQSARDAGMQLGFVTNNAARTPAEVATHLTELGVPAEPTNALQSLVSRLRRALGESGLVVQEPRGYRLAVD